MTPPSENHPAGGAEPVAPDTAAPAGDAGFWNDVGPEFDPESSPEPPEPETAAGEGGGWTPEAVVELLEGVQAPAFNALVNPMLGVSQVDWSHRHARLVAVAPAIAREWNQIPAVRGLAGHTDRGIILSYLLLEYLGPRAFAVIGERKAIRQAEQAQQAAEDAGYQTAAPPPSGPADVNDAGPRVTDLPPRRR